MSEHSQHNSGNEKPRGNGDSVAPPPVMPPSSILDPAPGAFPDRPAQTRMGRTLAVTVAAAGIVLAVAFFLTYHHRATADAALAEATAADESAPPDVDVVPVVTAPTATSLPLPGQVRGWYESTIYARVDGYVDKWFVDIGDHVKQGQTLATIDTPELDQQLIMAQHKLAVSHSNVEVAQASSDFAKTTFDRWRDSPKGVVSDQEREEKQAEYNTSVARLHAASAQVAADQADVDRLLALSDYKKVVAPFDGVITGRHVDIGDLVTAGSTANTAWLFSVAQIDKVRLFVNVPQRVAAAMQPDVKATATSNEFPGKEFSGTIARTSRSFDPAANTMLTEVDLENPAGLLVPGMYMDVSFHFDRKGLLEVPASALIFRPGMTQVAVVDADGVVHFQTVTIAVDDGNQVELASGITSGDRVALNMSNQVAEGDHVDAHEISSSGEQQAPTPPDNDSKPAALTLSPVKP